MAPAADRLAALSESQRQELESLLLDFEVAWTAESLAGCVEKLPSEDRDYRYIALLELIRIDLERQWQAGNRRGVEDYLQRFPELGTTENVAPELLLAEYQARRLSGAPCELRDFGQRFPQQIQRLEQLLQQSIAAASQVSRAAHTNTSRAGEKVDTQAEPTAKSWSLPMEFGRYRILKALGEGGMGSVFLAHDTELDRQVAIKTPKFAGGEDPQLIERFYREARAAAKLQNRHICSVYDVGEIDGVRYISMAYIEGRPLSIYTRSARNQPERSVVLVVRRLSLALQEAHTQGVIHRDLKPANIMIDGKREPVIMDFGLARQLDQHEDSRLTKSGMVLGTPAYMSPEQISSQMGRVGPASDVYSLGVILYELLTGRVPFEGSMAAVLGQIMTQRPPRPSEFRADLDPRLEQICLKMMAKRIKDRYASMQEVADALGQWLQRPADDELKELEDDAFASGISPTQDEDQQPQDMFATPYAQGSSDSVNRSTGNVTSSPVPAVSGWKRSHTVWLATGFLGLILLGLLIVLRTPRGVLKIDIQDPNLIVLIDGNEYTVEQLTEPQDLDAGSHRLGVKVGDTVVPIGRKLTLKTAAYDGQYKLAVSLDGANLTSESFTIVRGDERVLSIALESAPAAVAVDASSAAPARQPTMAAPPTSPPNAGSTATPPVQGATDQDRTVGLLVLGLGGKLTIRVAGTDHEISSVDQFPNTPFAVVKVNLNDKPTVNDDHVRSIAQLKSVRTLLLGGTQVTDAAIESIVSMPSLHYLFLANTRVTDVGVKQLPICQTLDTLDLTSLPLTDACLPSIARLENLAALALRNTQISDEGLKQLWPLRRLTGIALTATKITDDGLAHLTKLKRLESVELNHMPQLTADGIQHLLENRPLVYIHLDKTLIGDETLALIGTNPLVRLLSLNGTNVSDQGLRHLEGLLNPATIRLSGTKVTAAGVRRLGERYPGCEIVVDPELAKALPPRGQRTVLQETAESDTSTYGGLAPGKWVSLVPSREPLVGWWIGSAEVQNIGGSWVFSSSPLTADGCMGAPFGRPPKDIVWRVKVKGRDWKGLMSVNVRNVSLGDGGWRTYALDVSPQGAVTLKIARNDGHIILGRSSLPPSFDSSEFELAVGAIGRRLAAFVNGTAILAVEDSDFLQAGGICYHCTGSVTLERMDCQILDYVTTPTIQQILDTPADIQRETAQWVLRLGGTVAIAQQGVESAVTTLNALPTSPFSLVRVSMVGAKDLMTDLALSKLGPLPELQSLDLSGAPISDAGLEHMKNARNLKELNLTGTEATTAGVTSLQQAIPACKIVASPAVPAASEALPKEEPSTTSRTESPLLDSEGNWKLPTGAPPPAIAPFDAAMARQHQDAWASYLGVPVETTNSIGMKLVLIPPGEFDMGSTQEEVDRLLAEAKQRKEPQWYIDRLPAEAPRHRVRITRGLCLGAFEVTVGQFRQFVADTGHVTDGEKDGKGGICPDVTGAWVQKPEWTWRQPSFEQSDNDPVVHVSWNDAVAFCEWLSRKDGTTYRLPTEAEWEYACRAGSATKWSCGNEESGLDEYAWYGSNSQGHTHPVGAKRPNALGLYDMHGNVWEWCQDWLDAGYYKNSRSADPAGPTAGSNRAYRGGCWIFPAALCLSAYRDRSPPFLRGSTLGFRVATVPRGR